MVQEERSPSTQDFRFTFPTTAATASRSRHAFRASFANNVSPSGSEGAVPSQEGGREDRVRAAPAVSCAKAVKKTHTSIQVQRKQSGLPCAMVLTVSFELSLVTGLFLTIIRVMRSIIANLTPAPGRQDHTTSPSALALFVNSAAASTASRPTFVTIAKRPSFGTGWRGISR
jgi:hypothetical protein